MQEIDPVRRARGRVARYSRGDRGDTVKLVEARRELTAAFLEREILKALAAEYPPTAAARAELAALLTNWRESPVGGGDR